MNIKKLVGAVCLASLGVGGLAASASAVTCTAAFAPWTNSARCAIPNNVKGRSIGSGTIGTLTQVLTAHLDQATAGGASDKATATGFTSGGQVVVGQFAACIITDTNPNFNVGRQTVGGDCRDGTTLVGAVKHRVVQTF